MTLHDIFGAIFLAGFAGVILFIVGAMLWLIYMTISERQWGFLIFILITFSLVFGMWGYSATQ